MIDDYHNVHAKKVPAQLVTSRAIHMPIGNNKLVEIQQIPAMLQPPLKCVHSQACEGQCQRNRINLLQWNRWTSNKRENAASTGKHGENIHDTALSCYAEGRSQKLRVNSTVKI